MKDPKQIKPFIMKLLKYYSFSKTGLASFEVEFDQFLEKAQEKVRNAPEYKKMVVDFADGLSYKALLLSIFTYISGIRFGKDEDGNWTFATIPEELRT